MALETVPLRQIDTNLVFTFTYSGMLVSEATQPRLYNDTGRDRLITKIRVSVGTPPIGSNLSATVLKNGYNLMGSGGIVLSPGEYTDTGIPTNQEVWKDGEYLTVSILSVGTTFPGEDLTINVTVSE